MRSLSLLSRIFIALAFLATPSFVCAQIPQRSDTTNTPIPDSGHNYVKSPIDTVNPANGALSIRIGVKMPSARGIQLPFSFAYDTNGAAYVSGGGGLTQSFKTVTTPFGEGGWSYSIPSLSAAPTTWTYIDIGDKKRTCTASVNYVFQDPSGNRHDLDLSVWAGLPDCANNVMNNGNYVQTVTQGGEGSISATTTSPLYAAGILSPTTVTDGDGNAFSFGTFALGNNTVYAPSTVTDRNGNTINLSTTSSWPFKYTDTLGRTALSISSLGSNPDTVTVAGLGSTYQVHWTSVTPTFTSSKTNITSLNCTLSQSHSALPVVSSIVLPDGQQFSFSYDSTYGMVNKITFPNGGYIRYVWGLNTQSEAGLFSVYAPPTYPQGTVCAYTYDTPAVTDRYVSYNGTTEVEHEHFSYSTTWQGGGTTNWTTKTTTVTTYDLVRTTQFNTVYTYGNVPTNIAPNTSDYPTGQIPVEIAVQHYGFSGSLARSEYKYWRNERAIAGQVTVLENNQSSQVNYFYNASEERTEEDDYDYASSAPSAPTSNGPPPTPLGTLLRKIVTSYATLGDNVVDKPSSVITYNGSGTRMSETDYAYDQTAVTSVSGVVEWTSGQNIGNLTTKTEWLNTGTSPVTTYTYDSTGQLLTKTDPATAACPSGCVTNYSYTDSYTIGTPPGNTNAYLTTLTLPSTNGVSHIEKYKYSYTDGNPTQMIDQNNQTTSFTFNDNCDRLTQIAYPDTGQTSVTYNDSGSNPTITISKLITSTSSLVNVAKMDGMGQTIQTQLTSDPAGTDYVDSTYDGMGLLYTSSNPYRSTSDPTYGITTYTYDALGRVNQVTHPDGAAVLTTYSGAATKVQDEGNGTNRVTRVSQTDGLGRLISVCEVTSAAQMGSSGTPSACNQTIAATGFLTTYQYDALGNLTGVSQGSMARTFSYDSLSRLTSTTNPETGTISYNYDVDTNCTAPNTFAALLVSKVDARGIRTCMQYDALRRILQKAYSDGTPTAKYNYDEAASNGVTLQYTIGRESSQSTAAPNSTAEIFSYDKMGRVIDNSQCSPQNCGSAVFSVTYGTPSNPGYDLLGDVTVSTNGANVTFNYSYNAAGRLTGMTSSLSDSNHPPSLLSNAQYNALGSTTSLTLGNGVSESYAYNPRTQLVSVAAGAGLYSLSMTYYPNGDVATANDSVNGSWNYGYDDFNRLCASNVGGQTALTCSSANNSGTQAFTYAFDQFSNRWAQNVTAGAGPAPQLSFAGVNNRADQFAYDFSGDVTNDTNNCYTYDAEGRIATVASQAGGVCGSVVASYVYDAEGRRVRKTMGGTSVDYLYDIAGHQIAEISSAGAWNRGEIYAGARHLGTYNSGTTFFNHEDWLGTERARSNVTGVVCETITSLPYGDGQNTVGTCGDESPMHFTGKMRDTESSLDDFGARYNSSQWGRFLSADPVLFSSDRLNDPQQLNLYSYVRNNPLVYLDPTGEKLSLSGDVTAAIQELCQLIGDACQDGGKNITYDADKKTLTVDLSGVDLEKNEGAKLLSQVVNSDKQYNVTVGTHYESLAGTQKNTTGIEDLPSFPDQTHNDSLKPPSGIDDLIAINPGVQTKVGDDCNCPGKVPPPYWGFLFHELAESYAKIDGRVQTYNEGHDQAISREKVLRDQRPGLSTYLPFSGKNTTVIPMVIKK